MDRISVKQIVPCILLGTIDFLYVLFMIGQMDVFDGKFNFKVLYMPGLLFGFLIFPAAAFIFWKRRCRIEWIDYTFVMIPLLLWLAVIPGGSFTNFLFVNFPLIWTVSLIYLFRFSRRIQGGNSFIVSLALWVIVAVILLGAVHFLPILPE